MSVKEQSSEMKAAYGQRFSQQDLTNPEENQNPQYLKTPESKEGGVELLANLARNLRVRLSGGGRKRTQARDDRRV